MTKSLAIWRAAFAHHRFTGWQYTGVVKYKDQFQNASKGMHAVKTDTTNQIPMATTRINTIWMVFLIQLYVKMRLYSRRIEILESVRLTL
jgi:hypothetical protein